MSDILHEADEAGGRYVLRRDGHASELTYRWRGGEAGRVMVADHTYTPPEQRGQGIAGRLVARAVSDARAGGYRIDPTCPYVVVWFDRHPEHADLRAGGLDRNDSTPPTDGNDAKPTTLDIRREATDAKGRWVTTLDGHEAEVTYTLVGDARIIIDHTAVPDALRGRGVGKRLVARAITDIRADGRALIPLCPFAKALIARTPEWQDVLAG